MTKAINFKLASLICATSLASVGSLTPAAKAIEVDPNPNDGKCYFIENDLTINYNEGTEYAAILNANPWIGNSDIAKEAASIFNTKTNQNWRFAWKATSGNKNKGQTDALNTWYWVRQGEGNPVPMDDPNGFYTQVSALMENFAQGFEYACPGSSVGEGVFDGLKIPGLIDKIRGADRRKIGKVLSALLFPRNVVAAGGLATQAYINDLAAVSYTHLTLPTKRIV